MGRINSRQKGAAGEREFAAYLRDYGYAARRGQQFSGHPDAPDVVTDLDDQVFFDVKRTEVTAPLKWLAKAAEDSGDKKRLHVIAWRKNGAEWVAMLPMKQLMLLICALHPPKDPNAELPAQHPPLDPQPDAGDRNGS